MDDEFEAYVRARYPALCRYAFALCGDWQTAEDLVQSALARCHRAFRRGLEHPEAYVLRSIANAHRSALRRFWHRETPSAELPEVATEADAELPIVVLEALRRLPVRQREVIVLRYLADRSEEETARVLGISRGTVKSRASRAIAALRESGLLTQDGSGRGVGTR